jgi:4-alpha-glucanotransferase
MPSARARAAELRSMAAEQIGFFRFGQLLAHEQHDSFQASSRALGLLLFGDLQIGTSHRDLWAFGGLLAAGLRMGAPPSRTNPEGQPWGYGVLDPDLYGTDAEPGAAVGFLRARAAKLLEEFDGLRVDHPHGLIDPWVYSSRDPDPLRAVQSGARLFSSPERPELSRWAIARPEQIDLAQALHGDGRVRDLTPEQVERYARLFDVLVDAAGARGRAVEKLIAEVLSTLPYPVRRVLDRHGLGRFRVTQKASTRDAADVYRAENAKPDDWIMAGTHDTPPVWQVAERWVAEGPAAERAAYLATRLVPDQSARPSWAERVATLSRRLARAQLADLFVGPARNVMIFFPDLLGLHDVYNRPGSVSDQNWSLRVPPDFVERHARSAREGTALDLPAALAAAFRARGEAFAASHSGLLEELDRRAGPAPDQG